MKLTDITKKFTTEDKCLDYLEQMRWPNGDLCCIRCGVLNVSKITREAGKNKRVPRPFSTSSSCRDTDRGSRLSWAWKSMLSLALPATHRAALRRYSNTLG